MKALRAAAAAVVLFCCTAAALAATLTVQPGDSLAAALARAADGDTVQLAAGLHSGQVGVVTQARLTLRGLPDAAGRRPVLDAAGQHAEGKAIVVVRSRDGGDVRIEDIDFRGARVPDGNGAGIRFERGRLTVLRCSFVDNQNGILTANFADAELHIADSRFADAPAGPSLPHLLYVGNIARLTLERSSFSGGRGGHLVKSRAALNRLQGNRLVDGPGGQAAYELEFPNGGMAWLDDNLIGQSATTTNPVLLSFGAEGDGGGPPREHGLFMTGNTLVNHGLRPAVFVRVHPLSSRVQQRHADNRTQGLGGGAPPN